MWQDYWTPQTFAQSSQSTKKKPTIADYTVMGNCLDEELHNFDEVVFEVLA